MNTIQIYLIGSINYIINFKYAIINVCQKKHQIIGSLWTIKKTMCQKKHE